MTTAMIEGNATYAAAKDYHTRGLKLVLVEYKTKRAVHRDWTKRESTDEELAKWFANGHGDEWNIGIEWGEKSSNRVDVDHDCYEARALAHSYLPETGWRFGRRSASGAHWIYEVGTSLGRIQFEDPVISAENAKREEGGRTEKASAMLVEIRGTGHQTVVPPSLHESGERIEWEVFEEVGVTSLSELTEAVGVVAAGALLARYWPAQGKRHELSLSLHGGLQRGGWSEADSAKYVQDIARIAGDEEAEGRGETNARTTAKRLKDKTKTATGWPELARLLGEHGEAIVEKVREWLGMVGSSGASKKQGLSQAEQLVHLAEEADLFHDPDSEAFATIPVAGHKETYRIRAKSFRRWIVQRYYEVHSKPPGSQALQDAIAVLEGKALYDGQERMVHVRIAEHDGGIYLDLCNDEWEVVEVTRADWRVISGEAAPVRFKRPKGMKPLPHPVAGSLTGLRKLLNLPEDDDGKGWVLVCSWLVASLRPEGPYPILVLQGEQGSAKSTAQRILRATVDPSTTPLRTTPRDERDLMIAANNSRIVAFDNLSGLPTWLSDALCRLATGGGFSTRELYSDDEETLFDAMRPTMLNGISDVASRPDLVDRSLIVELPVIQEDQRRTERELWDEFDREIPKILGALLDAVSCGLRELPCTRLENLPRMADFARWATAAEKGLGFEEGAFMNAYTENRAGAVVQALEGDPVAEAVLEFMHGLEDDEWEGTASKLLDKLALKVSNEEVLWSKAWPKTPNALSGLLKRLAPALRAAAGIEYEEVRGKDKKRTRKKRLRRRSASDDARPSSDGSGRSSDDCGPTFDTCLRAESDAPDGADDDLRTRSSGSDVVSDDHSISSNPPVSANLTNLKRAVDSKVATHKGNENEYAKDRPPRPDRPTPTDEVDLNTPTIGRVIAGAERDGRLLGANSGVSSPKEPWKKNVPDLSDLNQAEEWAESIPSLKVHESLARLGEATPEELAADTGLSSEAVSEVLSEGLKGGVLLKSDDGGRYRSAKSPKKPKEQESKYEEDLSDLYLDEGDEFEGRI